MKKQKPTVLSLKIAFDHKTRGETVFGALGQFLRAVLTPEEAQELGVQLEAARNRLAKCKPSAKRRRVRIASSSS